MKHLLETAWSRFINAPPRNPTQTKYTRFMKTPQAEFGGAWNRSVKAFEEGQKMLTKHPKSIWLEEFDD